MRVLFIGDIVGRPGRKALQKFLPKVRKEHGPFDFVIANVENAAGGFGITQKILDELLAVGIDCMTSGNHIWDKKEGVSLLDTEPRLLRPANYPPGCPGRWCMTLDGEAGRLVVLNLIGRTFMFDVDCPFRRADEILQDIAVPVLVDFHAEATSEKRALALYLDGRISALLGTHTHVATADEEILDGGTAFITDVGMTGGHAGVIGMQKDSVISRFLTAMPARFEACNEDLRLNGACIDIDPSSGKALSIRRISVREGCETPNE
ncbi:MAG: TIGR00282 family metallophosphoesterase [Acetomicrobium sp.]|nr:TIGR00282 family metallophosphoesterase [Acetomicrobium sp.]